MRAARRACDITARASTGVRLQWDVRFGVNLLYRLPYTCGATTVRMFCGTGVLTYPEALQAPQPHTPPPVQVGGMISDNL